MSGGRPFDRGRFVVLAEYALSEYPMSSEKLAWMMFRFDFEAYRRLGESITGATYLRGAHHPEVRELGIGWFQDFVRSRLPSWARIAGWALVACVILGEISGSFRRSSGR